MCRLITLSRASYFHYYNRPSRTVLDESTTAVIMSDTLNHLVGTWKLLSYEMTTVSGPQGSGSTTHPAGTSLLGRIIFPEDNDMSAMVTEPSMDLQRKLSPWNMASDEEVLRVAPPMVTYCGRFHITKSEDDILLSTKVAISLDPTWMGGLQTRKVQLGERDGRRLLMLRPVQHFELPVSVRVG